MSQIEVYHVFPDDLDRKNSTAILREKEAHHLIRVRRAKPGDAIVIINGAGEAWSAIAHSFHREEVTCHLIDYFRDWHEPASEIHLGLGILKHDHFYQAVDFSVQLGVRTITPLLSQYVVAGWSENRSKRSHRVALAAAKQCGRGRIPGISSAQPLHKWCIEQKKSSHKILLMPEGKSLPDLRPGESISVAVGCEGGFTREEERWMLELGFHPVALGSRRLRSEVAVATILSRISMIIEEDPEKDT